MALLPPEENRAQRDQVSPVWITEQRAAGWPDMHPEDFCHRCGAANPMWVTTREAWLTATTAWAAETGREGICCPRCFIDMYEAATGQCAIWQLAIDGPVLSAIAGHA